MAFGAAAYILKDMHDVDEYLESMQPINITLPHNQVESFTGSEIASSLKYFLIGVIVFGGIIFFGIIIANIGTCCRWPVGLVLYVILGLAITGVEVWFCLRWAQIKEHVSLPCSCLIIDLEKERKLIPSFLM